MAASPVRAVSTLYDLRIVLDELSVEVRETRGMTVAPRFFVGVGHSAILAILMGVHADRVSRR